jgi:hypothetical protein
MYVDTEILFPNYVIPLLRERRGEEWLKLVDRILSLPSEHPEMLAFVLMMIRFNGCMECETDSYRAMRGCAACALQTLHRYKGSDQELIRAYSKALTDIEHYLAGEEEVRRIA